MTSYWVGGYGPDMGGSATGIARLESRPDGTLDYRGVAAVAKPSSRLSRTVTLRS